MKRINRQSTNRPSIVRIPQIGSFNAVLEQDGSISHYEAAINLPDIGSAEIKVIILPNQVGSAFRPEQKKKLGRRFQDFKKTIASTLKKLPWALRYLCLEYEFDISDLSDNHLSNGLEWQAIYLRRNGQIECLTRHYGIHGSLEIVIRFSKEGRFSRLWFEG
jgi:hypothetical protein